jgi:hypothetical protein
LEEFSIRADGTMDGLLDKQYFAKHSLRHISSVDQLEIAGVWENMYF